MNEIHVPVLLEEVLTQLNPQKGETYVDMTAGYGGHASAIIDRTHNPKESVLIDRDSTAIGELRKQSQLRGVQLMHADFGSAAELLVSQGRTFNVILADLGVSSLHLNESSRGFSIQANGPLDMRMDQQQALTAFDVVNSWSAADLASIMWKYGDEPKAKRIAEAIVASRPIEDTVALAALVKRAAPSKRSLHPATTVFQAIRIAVNDELGQLERFLRVLPQLVAPGGRVGIISFHSLEDRLVKQFFAQVAGERYDAEFRILTKKPVTANHNELVLNPRARSAKLRAAVKIKN